MTDLLINIQSAFQENLTFPNDWFVSQIEAMKITEAVMLICFGVVYLVNGWKIFRILTAATAGLAGMILGIKFSNMTGTEFWPPIVGFIAGVLIVVPFLHFTVAILGGAALALISGSVVHAAQTASEYLWIVMAAGFVAGFIISFKLFRFTVTMFTSYLGAVMAGMGLLNLAKRYMAGRTMEQETQMLNDYLQMEWFLPAFFLAIAFCGLLIQFFVGGKPAAKPKKDKDQSDD
ncbi:hypothetical protein SMSP2_00487 [Limihaloglobus sulfuriphilus]|uniref:DUF4203 domain-containing protein n=1 Tax=Limihaloglobus sulfuriphilus TaxID=1851148 RepID=A0A1Q2MBP3_9BACT|nr:hypothetical protein [Limihaloglobus sulfuriphilus]AQQ70145.1 hypothetical protein SMSP2_00487 [Limihaloglobus sulfuriphilus]